MTDTARVLQLKDGCRHGREWLLILVVLVGCRQSGTAQTPAAHSPATPAPLLVTIVVDQMAAWLADQRWPALDPGGGFARLRREGTTVREMRYQHAVTDTAPGHAALFTGTTPRENGIVANEVIGPQGGSPRSILADDSTHLLGFNGELSPRAGSSLGILQGETIADVFRASQPDGHIFSFSLKDRGALFGGGRHPDAVLWLDPESGAFVTSTAFATEAPAWLGAAGGRAAVAAAMTAGWFLSDDGRAWIAAHAATADAQRGEGDYGKLGTVFPHAIGSAKALRATPAGDRLLFGLARAALPRVAADHRPALLALSLSAHDYVAHVFGPDSWEAWDELRQLDRQLATFLAALDDAVGPGGYAVMLTGDHGGSPLPELAGTPADPWCRPDAGAVAVSGAPDRWERPCGPRRRLITGDLVATLESALAQAFGAGPWLAGGGIAVPLIFLGARARALDAGNQTRLLSVVKQALAPLGIADVVDVRRQRGPCAAPDDTRDQLICAATRPGQPGDLYMVVAPGAFFDPGYTPGFGTSHGSPYLYDRAVPLLVRAPGRVAAGRTVDGALPFSTFTRTASALLGVRPPTGAQPGQDLTALP
ncbi:MAG TPA: alkaline phosphatase family protein [Polyangia bacterium]|nr:alkaline phosphatase family protein [Polyangia bacterium]